MKNYVIIENKKYEIIGKLVQNWPNFHYWSNMPEFKFKIKCLNSFNLSVGKYKHTFKINDEFFYLKYELIKIRGLSSMKNEKIIQIHIRDLKRTSLKKDEERDLLINELLN